MIQKLKHILEMIKFSHSVFALPFALSALLLAAHGVPPIKTLLFIILAMIFARNTAMSFNRLVDAKIDAENPRTQNRHLPQGLLSKQFVTFFIVINAILFIASAFFLNRLAFILSPVALLIIYFYSFTKRFTNFSQIYLGFSLGIAPIAAWIAFKGTLDLTPILLGIAVLFWVAGFDIIYASQDYKYDQIKGLKSIVVRYGIPQSLIISRFFHVICISVLLLMGALAKLSIIYYATLLIMSLFFIYEHSLVKPHDLSKVNLAFFTVNGFVGILFLTGMFIEVMR